MKILYHHRTLGDGAEGIHIREMVSAFRQLGHEVVVMGPTGEATGRHSEKGAKLHRVKAVIPRIVFELCELGYPLYLLILIWARSRNFRPDFIYDRYITFNFGSVLAAKILGIPLFLEVNAPLALERSNEPDETLIFQKTALAIERWVCMHATRTIVVSTPLKEYLFTQGVPEEKCIVMPNGVNPITFQPRKKDEVLLQRIGAKPGMTIIGFTGILRPWHGLDMLADAVCRLTKHNKEAFLLIVGDGPIREELEMQLRQMGLEGKYFITGRIPYEEVPGYVNLFDIAVSPKATFYASPMKIVEYMSLQKAVVAPDTKNIQDLIDTGSNGLLFHADSVNSLAESLQRLIDSPQLRVKIGVCANQEVLSRLNWEWNALQVCKLLESCCQP